MIEIPIKNKGLIIAHSIIDDEDYDLVSEIYWHLDKGGYAVRSIKTAPNKWVPIGMHRVIMHQPLGNGLYVDHIDRNKLNNCRSNLRVVTHQQNDQNKRPKKGTSKYRNVHWDKVGNRWIVCVSVNKKTIYLGQFFDEEEANRVAKEWRKINMPFAVEYEETIEADEEE